MKPIAAAVCLLFATSLMQAQTPPGAKPADPKAPAAKATPAKAAPGKAAPAKTEAKKEEELPKIPGTEIARPNGTKLGLEVVDGKFKLTFYDKKHKPMAMDVTRATARWPNTRSGTPSDYRTVLNGSGTSLIGARPVLPPYTFTVFLTLLQGEGDEAKAVENYAVPVKG
ncbi:MAG TPA: hypothetical protein VGD97_04000 [Lacunisphaera sp.]